VTVIAAPDQAEAMNASIRDQWPTIWYDLILVQSSTDLLAVFNQRLSTNRRFG